MNKTIILGNLGRDPEMRYMPDGTAVTAFSVAVKEGWGDKAYTLWYRCSVWGKRAEAANQYLSKGTKVLVEGRLQGDPETGAPKLFNRKDGTQGASFELRVSDWEFAGGSNDNTNATPQARPAAQVDDIPF